MSKQWCVCVCVCCTCAIVSCRTLPCNGFLRREQSLTITVCPCTCAPLCESAVLDGCLVPMATWAISTCVNVLPNGEACDGCVGTTLLIGFLCTTNSLSLSLPLFVCCVWVWVCVVWVGVGGWVCCVWVGVLCGCAVSWVTCVYPSRTDCDGVLWSWLSCRHNENSGQNGW